MEAFPRSPENNRGDDEERLNNRQNKSDKKEKKSDFIEALRSLFTREDEQKKPGLLDRLLGRDREHTRGEGGETESERSETRLERMRGRLLRMFGVSIEAPSEGSQESVNDFNIPESDQHTPSQQETQVNIRDNSSVSHIELIPQNPSAESVNSINQNQEQLNEGEDNEGVQATSMHGSSETLTQISRQLEEEDRRRQEIDAANLPSQESPESENIYDVYHSGTVAPQNKSQDSTRGWRERIGAYTNPKSETRKSIGQNRKIKKVEKLAKELEKSDQLSDEEARAMKEKIRKLQELTALREAQEVKADEQDTKKDHRGKFHLPNPFSAHARAIETPAPAQTHGTNEQKKKDSSKIGIHKLLSPESPSETSPVPAKTQEYTRPLSNQEILDQAKRDHLEQYGIKYDPETLKRLDQREQTADQDRSDQDAVVADARDQLSESNTFTKSSDIRIKTDNKTDEGGQSGGIVPLVVLIAILFIIYIIT